MNRRWPWPGDTPTDRVRRMVTAYREALLEAAPGNADELDSRFTDYGEGWVRPPATTPINLDEEITVTAAAALVQRRPSAIYRWIAHGRLPKRTTHAGIRVTVRDVLDVQRDLRLGRSS